MAESTCLHIQEHDAGPIRIVEIPWISVRIGRAAFCEVRLNDPSLPEEACRLHRRGRTWHLTPLGGSDVSLDGTPVDAPRPLPYDVPFRVGGFQLSLKPGKFAEPDWRGPRDEPRRPRAEAPAEPAGLANSWEARWRAAGDRLQATRPAPAEARPASTAPAAAPSPAPPTPTAPPRPTEPVADRRPMREVPRAVARRVEPTTRPRPAAPPKAPTAPRYGPSAYARPAAPAPRPASPPKAPPAPRPEPPRVEIPATAPEAWSVAAFEVASPPVATPPASVPTPTPAPPAPAVEFLDPDRLARLERLNLADLDDEPAAVAALLDARPLRGAPERSAPVVAEPAPLEVESEPEPVAIEAVAPTPLAIEFEAPADRDAGPVAIEDDAPADVEPDEIEPLDDAPDAIEPADEAPPVVDAWVETTPEFDEADARSGAEADVELDEIETAGPEAEAAWGYGPTVASTTAGHLPFVADTNDCGRVYDWADAERRPRPAKPPAPRPVEADEDDAEAFDPTRSKRSRPSNEWVLPSVQDVLNAGLRRGLDEAKAIPRPPSRAPRPSAAAPTEAMEPGCWEPPAWLTAPAAFATTLAVGGLLAFGSWRQAVVSHDAATAIRASAGVRLGLAKDRPLPPSIVPPAAKWWAAAPAHLAQWGVYLDGTRVEHDWDATAADMLEAATASGPLDPLARYALALKAEAGGARPALGLSRDAVSLAWTGRALHKAGRDAAAVKAYRRALEIAAKADPDAAGPLDYSDDPDVPRYLLPGEGLAAAIVRDLAGDASWRYDDWAGAVPESGVSALAAARVLRKQGRPEADAILRRIVERAEADAKARAGGPDEPADDPEAEALGFAVEAEALALRADLKGAERRYHAAIDRMADPRVRRSWWFNLADVEYRLDDDDRRRAALDEALASVDADDVSRRALELQRGVSASASGTMDRLRPSGPRAN